MKATIVKMIAAATLFVVGSTASAECYVYVNLCPLHKDTPRTVFLDGDARAQIDPNRCLERAREFVNWCQGPNAVTYFYSGSVPKTAVVVNLNGGSQIYSTDLSNGRWVPLQSSY